MKNLALMLLAASFIAGCSREHDKTPERMLIVASVAPLAHFARQVGGNHVRVELIIPPGASPHTYQLSPDQMKMLSQARVLVLNGIGLEFWAQKAIDAAGNRKLIVVHTAEGIPILGSGDRGHRHGNPHVWLDPLYAACQVEAIRKAFVDADPKHAARYHANASAYIRRLKELDRQIRKKTSSFRIRKFVAFHPAWVYFAQRYRLQQAAVIEESPGKEPSPAEIADIVRTAKRIGARAIFAEPQFSPKAAEVVAEEVGAKVLMLDPLGKPPNYDYIATMRANLRQMEEALQ